MVLTLFQTMLKLYNPQKHKKTRGQGKKNGSIA